MNDLPASKHAQSIPAATSGSRSKLLSTNFKAFLSKPALGHPQKALTVQLHNAEQQSNMDPTAGQTQEAQDDKAVRSKLVGQ
jgi:hypothetical protein